MRNLIWLSCLSYMVIGMAHVVAGAVLEPMMASYGLSYGDGGQFIMNQFLGFLGGVLITPWLTRRVGKRRGLLLALGMLTGIQALYSLLLPWAWMLAIAPIAGFGFGMTETIIGAVIIDAVQDKKASAMTRIEAFFGLGALAMPALAALLIKQGLWQWSFPIVMVLALLTVLLWARLPMGQAESLLSHKREELQQAATQQPGYSRAMLPFLLMGVAYFLFYVGMEMGFSNYLPSIMINQTGMDQSSAAMTMSLFWGLMVVGRLFAGRLADGIGHGRYLIISTAAGTMMFVFLLFSASVTWSLLFIALSGLIWSGVFAIGLVYINGQLPGMTERTTSLLVACGGLGGALFPRFSGSLMDNSGAPATLSMYVGMAVLMFLLMAGMLVVARRRNGMKAV
ncbi:MFS transporter [Paenibacillus daejeonensis]|uniref:MFS transporter n=1 Tax=Paenibacillus daejeonensis TaxID=135193 RepID=UPI00039CA89C|nr:MFS transporter [Paenibacillus daejeonensis]